MSLAQRRDRFNRQQPRLIKATIGEFRSMKRHGHHKQTGRCVQNKRPYRLRQQYSQPSRGRTKPFILQSVNDFAHSALIGPEGNCTGKRRRRQTAGAAYACPFRSRSCPESTCRVDRIAAADTERANPAWNFRPARIADWNGRETREARSAKRTGRWEEDATDGIHGTSKHTRHCPPFGNLRWRNTERG